jgi:hypothetical protein
LSIKSEDAQAAYLRLLEERTAVMQELKDIPGNTLLDKVRFLKGYLVGVKDQLEDRLKQ